MFPFKSLAGLLWTVGVVVAKLHCGKNKITQNKKGPGFTFTNERRPKADQKLLGVAVGAALRRSPNKVSVPEEV